MDHDLFNQPLPDPEEKKKKKSKRKTKKKTELEQEGPSMEELQEQKDAVAPLYYGPNIFELYSTLTPSKSIPSLAHLSTHTPRTRSVASQPIIESVDDILDEMAAIVGGVLGQFGSQYTLNRTDRNTIIADVFRQVEYRIVLHAENMGLRSIYNGVLAENTLHLFDAKSFLQPCTHSEHRETQFALDQLGENAKYVVALTPTEIDFSKVVPIKRLNQSTGEITSEELQTISYINRAANLIEVYGMHSLTPSNDNQYVRIPELRIAYNTKATIHTIHKRTDNEFVMIGPEVKTQELSELIDPQFERIPLRVPSSEQDDMPF